MQKVSYLMFIDIDRHCTSRHLIELLNLAKIQFSALKANLVKQEKSRWVSELCQPCCK